VAIAKLHSRKNKFALILVKANKFQATATPAYVPLDSVEDVKEGESFHLPDGYRLNPMVDVATGEARTAADGSPLHTLAWG
jgi:hypothetical protein